MFESHCFHLTSVLERTSKEINFIHYDCVDQQNMKIKKIVQFISKDNQPYYFEVYLDSLKYENYWYFFGMSIMPFEKQFVFSIFQNGNLQKHQEIEIELPFKNHDLEIVIGGGLQVDEKQYQNSSGQKLSYFPGKLDLYHPFKINKLPISLQEFFLSISTMYNPKCIPKSNQIQNFPDFEINKLNTQVFASENKNCDSFSLETWIKIQDFHLEESVSLFQLLKLSSNFENIYANNENLSAFQLFYEFQNSEIKLIVSTYSYLFPLVNFNFEKENFLIKKEWIINDNLKQWHFLSVILRDNLITIQLTFYKGFDQQFYETQIQVNQFHEVQFKLQLGNIFQSLNNYLIGILQNIKFTNFAPQLNSIKSCHYSCKECDGPTYTDCLSCLEESQRIYLKQFKVCVCPYDFVDDIECKNFEYFQLSTKKQLQFNIEQNCPQGYFNQDEVCLRCPSLIFDNSITCTECIQNPKEWQYNPYCQTNLYIDNLGSPAQYIINDLKIFYIFDGIDLKPSLQQLNDQQEKIENTFFDYAKTTQNFNYLCSFSTIMDCYPCTIENCEVCGFQLTKFICIKCSYIAKLVDGSCILKIKGQIKLNNCTTPYYISSEKSCKLCKIEYCQYCFEYLMNDLTKCTLYYNFQSFPIDEFLNIGCALCDVGFIFDFQKGKCLFKDSKLPYCLRSFINLSGQELCTLSSIQDFKVAPEIINCQKYIPKCKQCIQTPQSILKCIICEDGYSSSLITGHCTICTVKNAKYCIEGDYTKSDAWIQLIQSFLMLFLPNNYIYPKSPETQYIISLPVQCIDKYELNQQYCDLYCDQNCASCQKIQEPKNGFICKKCFLNYYMESYRTVENGNCLACPPLCQVCQSRTIEEIQNINSLFVITDQNKIYTLKCIKKYPDSNIFLDPYYQTVKYCINGQCEYLFSYQIENNCQQLLEIFYEEMLFFFMNKFNSQYLNHVGMQKLQIIIPIYELCIQTPITEWKTLINQLKSQIFTLIWAQLIFEGNYSLSSYQPKIKIVNFDSIQITKLQFLIYETFEFKTFNNDKPINFTFSDSIFLSENTNILKFQIEVDQCHYLDIKNITFKNIIIQNSILFLINFQVQSNSFSIFNLTMKNCNLTDTTIFQIKNALFDVQIKNILIENCYFQNSTILQFIKDINSSSLININNINDLIIMKSHFHNSLLIIGLQSHSFNLKQISLIKNEFYSSKFMIFQNNLNIIQTILKDCSLYQSDFLIKLSNTNSNTLLIDKIDIQDNIIMNSSFILTEQQSIIHQVVIKIKNLYIQSNKVPKQSNSTKYLFYFNCQNLYLQNFEIMNSNYFKYFYLLSVSSINVEDLIYVNLLQNLRIPISIECLEIDIESSQLFYISGFLTVSFNRIQIINQYSIDQSFIQIQSNQSVLISEQEQIYIKDLSLQGNILIKKNLGLIYSLLTIYSERKQKITLENIYFKENSFNQIIDDPSQVVSSLLYINSQSSLVFITNLTSQRNSLTNSTSPFIYIKANTIAITTMLISNHNYLNQSFWNQYFQVDLNENFNQEQINQIAIKIFSIKNKGGVLSITTENFQLDNSFFKEILAQSSSIIDIVTQGQGIVKIKNCQMHSIQNIYSLIEDNEGAISIYSKNSLLLLELQDIIFNEMKNKLASSLLSVIPSYKTNKIKFQNIIIKNCISLINQFMNIKFQLLNVNSNFVQMENIQLFQSEDQFLQYFQNIGSITTYEIKKITNDNAIINLQGCNLSIKNLTFSGILLSSILKLVDLQNIYLKDIRIYQAQLFYPINLLHFGQASSISYRAILQNILIKNLTTYNFSKLNMNIIPQSNYEISKKQCIINFQQMNLNLEMPKQVSWIFEQILILSNQQGSLLYFQNDRSQINIKMFQIIIQNNDCQECWNGMIFFDLASYLSIQITELTCIMNKIKNYGCLIGRSKYQEESKLLIKNSLFYMNFGNIGTAITIENIKLVLQNSKLLNNHATSLGGALYLKLQNNEFKISKTLILNNKAQKGGGIYLEGKSNLNQKNLIKSQLQLNSASLLPNNLQEMPTHLALSINNFEMHSNQIKYTQFTCNSLFLNPYRTVQQGKILLTKVLKIPSNQEIIKYKIYNIKLLRFQQYLQEFSISFRNSLNELLSNFSNSSCQIYKQILQNNDNNLEIIDSVKIANAEYNSKQNNFDLGFLSITIDPYQQNNAIQQIQIQCNFGDQVNNDLIYEIEIKGFMCQLGEFYIQSGCQVCQPSQGYYSVTYNQTKCSIFDQNKFQSITSNQIQLKKGYWRPDYLSDYTEFCFKNSELCEGGWQVGDALCIAGHIGGLCEECDIYNIRGYGYFQKFQQNADCRDCLYSIDIIIPFIFTSIWAIISTLLTLKSIDKSNKLFSSLKIRQKYAKIIFKLDQDHGSILLKLFLNYVWIFSVIFTFNINFSFQFTFIDQASNTSFFMANNLDCYLSEIENIYLIYNRIITMFILMILQLLLISFGYKIFTICKKQKFNYSTISTTILHLYISNYASLIKQLLSLLAKRIISNIEYIQGDVSLKYNQPNHQKWIIMFVLPGLGLIGCIIPFSIFFLLYIKREKLDQIKFRKHICYLFNEYNYENYSWECVKLCKKTIIIIIMTYYETNILLKASLLGLCLLIYQLCAVKQKPYIIKNLNELDVSTGQICSIAIFLAAFKYVSEYCYLPAVIRKYYYLNYSINVFSFPMFETQLSFYC
ncbi:unnamed protein product [Paramecium sonneborni]|uniref:Transmembrane protein n=1 Tax=Paramecium sonneborni TaxID=65129 RepID=A0A8S1RKW8_9CILI|nr:unnamed protein product [Paramecium sonneborni]